MVELQIVDVLADFGAYLFAREFLRDRGYRVCLDGLSALSLPAIDHEALRVDLVKLWWSGETSHGTDERDGARTKEAVARLLPERVILSHCDNEQAVAFGRSLGITLFQGHQVDHLLKNHATLQDTVEALANARARQREAERSLDRAS